MENSDRIKDSKTWGDTFSKGKVRGLTIIILLLLLIIVLIAQATMGSSDKSGEDKNGFDFINEFIDQKDDDNEMNNVAGNSNATTKPMDSDTLTTGYVTSINTQPWAYDGNAVVKISLNGVNRQLEIPARLNLCPAADDIVSLDELSVGDKVYANGEYTDAGKDTMVICGENHFLKITEKSPENNPAPTAEVKLPITMVAMIGKPATEGPFSISVQQLVEDSRCPQDVDCIWAGTVKIAMTFKGPNVSSGSIGLELGQTYEVAGYTVEFFDVRPYPKSTGRIDSSDYQFSFRVDSK